MHRLSSVVLSFVVALLGAPGSALAADDAPSTPVGHSYRDVVVEVDATEATIVTPEEFARAGSKILYVNRCEGGETVYRGYNDSRQNTSSIIGGTTTFPEYPYGDEQWNEVLADVRDMLAAFDIEVTDVDPGNVSHFEIIACGQSFRGENVLGVAPSGCGVVENAIGYAFAEEHGSDPRQLAETIVHEAGHTWSLPHLYDCEDPMTYLNGCGDKYFQDADLSCAELSGSEWVKVSCRCGGPTTNSFETVMSIFGPGTPTPPSVEILEPADGDTVDAGFVVRPEVFDDQGVEEASLYIDGELVLTLTQGPFVFNAPADIGGGSHVVEVRAKDRPGAVGSASISVIVGEPCACADGESCIDGRCVPGPGQPGGLGSPCGGSGDCASGLCATAGTEQYCTETCSGSCPGGFDCVPAGGSDVCWPNEESGGCQAGGSQAPAGALGGLLLLGLVAAFRRRG